MNIKAMEERIAELQERMEQLANEERALTEDEVKEFDAAEEEIRTIEEKISRMNRARAAATTRQSAPDETEDRAVAEERSFVDYVMGRAVEMRDGEQNVDMTNNGAIIPTTIANRIIKAVKDRCPILSGATMYSVKGTLKIPVWGKANTTHDITVGYSDDFTELTADAGKFTSVDLGGYLVGALTLIGRRVENNGVFNVAEFIINQMAEEIATFLEGQLLNGAENKAQGALATTNTLNAGSTSAITFDKLIELQAKVKQAYQANACWTMHPDTLTAVKKLKDGESRYLLQMNPAQEFPYTLLGKPVYVSDNMPAIASGAKAILYGDYSGLAVNMRENISIEVLREKYATQHAIGVVGWFEFDSKITDAQRLAALVMST